MEDGTKEDPAQHNVSKFLSKAGWVKKAHGRLLTSYKDRYIQVEKTEIVVYEKEDLQNCLERFDLENYDTCHELKSPFKKKHRLVLIRSPKSGNKVSDVKFQAQTAEEKEAWIKALSDCICRAKNKVLDEVKVDVSSNLEHVTRTRPKGNRNRRPPTRIHMKEVAGVSSDGILRLDLDLEDAVMPNGTHPAGTNGTETSHPSPQLEKQLEAVTEEEEKTEPEATAQKKIIKPIMPPTKEAKPGSDKPETDEKALKPPMPPSKEAKPCAAAAEEASEDHKAAAKKKTGPPPTPPNKPSISSSSPTEVSLSGPNSHPPTPPSKEKKPPKAAAEPDQQMQGAADEKKEKEEESGNESTDGAEDTEEAELGFEKALPRVGDDRAESSAAEEEGPDENTPETESCGGRKEPDNDQEETTDPRTSNLLHQGDPSVLTESAEELYSKPQTSEAPLQIGVPSVTVSANESLSLSPLLCHLSGEKKKKAEEKSVDSGQHSDDESEGSGSEDTLVASTAALHGSHSDLEVLSAAEDHVQTSDNLRSAVRLQVGPNAHPCRRSSPFQKPLKPVRKPRSASIGDLLSEPSGRAQLQQPSALQGRDASHPKDEATKLEAEVALEIERTSELLIKAQRGSYDEAVPEDLLAKALEKLKKADNVLREVQKLKFTSNSSNRMSW